MSSTGTDILRIRLRPRLHTKNENTVIMITHFLYDIFLHSVEKYIEIELISPTQVVRHASVKIAASKIVPGKPNSCVTMSRSNGAPLFTSGASGYTADELAPMYASMKYTNARIEPAITPAIMDRAFCGRWCEALLHVKSL